jgi:hypothetical protein
MHVSPRASACLGELSGERVPQLCTAASATRRRRDCQRAAPLPCSARALERAGPQGRTLPRQKTIACAAWVAQVRLPASACAATALLETVHSGCRCGAPTGVEAAWRLWADAGRACPRPEQCCRGRRAVGAPAGDPGTAGACHAEATGAAVAAGGLAEPDAGDAHSSAPAGVQNGVSLPAGQPVRTIDRSGAATGGSGAAGGWATASTAVANDEAWDLDWRLQSAEHA